ncbi:MAG: anthranilate synthase component I [Leptolyngbyaceae bacterium]|nr:anthranilate synthase component I [Leptolyngbyaceae bacterium]
MTIHPLAPWHWRSHPLAQRTGSDIFKALFLPNRDDGWTEQTIATLLESPTPSQSTKGNGNRGRSPLTRYSICAGAPRIIHGARQCWTPSVGHVLPTLDHLLASAPKSLSCPAHLPFTGGWLGWLGYDVAREIEQLPSLNPDPLPFPPAFWYVPDCFAVLDHWEQQLWIAATDASDLDALEATLTQVQESDGSNTLAGTIDAPHKQTHVPITFVSDQSSYEAAVRQAKKYIRAGDIFQANLSLRFSSPCQVDSWTIYQTLHQLNPSPFASYWHTPWGSMMSCSPERLVQRRGNQVQTRPIAGTRPRGSTPQQDHDLEKELLDNRKENAEHIMLVDLERNDLGRVCEWGSVAVDELLTIERYSHVMHLVSNVVGTVRSPHSSVDLIRALFPGGTITGCPKVRCMEIIEELEPARRNLFYGSCGYIDWRGDLDLNILIRTMLCVPPPPNALENQAEQGRSPSLNTIWGQIGAGIVADSQPAREWAESLSKAQAQLEALASAQNLSLSR